MKDRIKLLFRNAVRPMGAVIARSGISADAVTLAGLVFAIVAAWGFYRGNGPLAFIALLASGLCDLLDGAVARAGGGRGTAFGAALDSTLDRYGEGLIFGAILARAATAVFSPWLVLLAVLAGVGSYLVSYVRARSEGLGISCEVGFLERGERVVLLLALALWGDAGLPWLLGTIAALSHVTFVHRLIHIRRRSAAKDSGAEHAPRQARRR